MDANQTWILRETHARIVAGNFGAIEVIALLSLLREDSPQGGVLRELGNFTHRRRDSGRVHRYARRLKDFLDNYRANRADTLQTNLVFTETEIANALDQELQRYGLAAFTQMRQRQVQLVMLATLQNVALVDDNNQQFGQLGLWVTPGAFQLMGAVQIPARVSGTTIVMTPALEVVNDSGWVPPPGATISFLTVNVRGGIAYLQGSQ